MKRWLIAVAAGLMVATTLTTPGCRGTDPVRRAPISAPISAPIQPVAADVFADERFFTLLDAELPGDQFFTRSRRTRGNSFNGDYAFAVDGVLDVPMGNLWPGGDVPGNWQLLAWHVRPAIDGVVRLSLLSNGRPISVSRLDMRGGHWQPIAVDLQPLRAQGITQSNGLLLRLEMTGTADDLLLVDNQRELHHGQWTVTQRGLIRRVGDVALPGIAPVDEVNGLRFRSGGMTIYRNGQQFDATQVPTPGRISSHDVRVVRTSPTDIDGDGFDDGRGAFVLAATEPRAALLFEPAGAVHDPAFEISGLPTGQVIVTFAGELSARIERLDDGTVLFVLPGTFVKPTPIQIRVR